MSRSGRHSVNATYLSITQGKIRESFNVTADTPNAEMRTAVNPKTQESKEVWEVVDDSITGILTKVEFEKNEFGAKMNLVLSDFDTGENLHIQMKRDSGYAQTLMEILPMADLSKEVKIAPYNFEDKDTKKRKIGCSVTQQESMTDSKWSTKVPKKWTKDNPGDKPAFPEDWKDEFEMDAWRLKNAKFLVNHTNTVLVPMLNKKPWEIDQGTASKNVSTQPQDFPEIKEDETDDLPF